MATTSPYRVCLVCLGNICRSPMAAAVLERRLAEQGLTDSVVVESAGTGAWHVGNTADSRALRTLGQHGYDGTRHRARQFTPDWFDRFDLIVALDQHNLADLRAMAPGPGQRAKIRLLRSFDPDADTTDLDVPDPYYGSLDDYRHALRLIENAIPGLIDEVRSAIGAEPTRRS